MSREIHKINTMKKGLIFFTLMLIYTFTFGQTTVVKSDSTKYIYCELRCSYKLLSSSVNVVVDFGESTKLFQDARMKDEETENIKKFNSKVDALNYMASKNWEVIQAYALNVGSLQFYFYLLRKVKV